MSNYELAKEENNEITMDASKGLVKLEKEQKKEQQKKYKKYIAEKLNGARSLLNDFDKDAIPTTAEVTETHVKKAVATLFDTKKPKLGDFFSKIKDTPLLGIYALYKIDNTGKDKKFIETDLVKWAKALTEENKYNIQEPKIDEILMINLK
ncbi:MAG: hypothetical protein ACRC5H_01825, partial [Treponemataceae bacterium]